MKHTMQPGNVESLHLKKQLCLLTGTNTFQKAKLLLLRETFSVSDLSMKVNVSVCRQLSVFNANYEQTKQFASD